MHHYGGVYSDIKGITIDWATILESLNQSSSLYAAGPSESTVKNVSQAPGWGCLARDQELHFQSTLYPAAYACKPYTPFTRDQLNEIERRLNYFEDLLAANPAVQPWGLNSNYPVPWNAMHGQIFSPLNLKYSNHIKAIPGILNKFDYHR